MLHDQTPTSVVVFSNCYFLQPLYSFLMFFQIKYIHECLVSLSSWNVRAKWLIYFFATPITTHRRLESVESSDKKYKMRFWVIFASEN